MPPRPHHTADKNLRTLILTRDKYICGICGHPGADTLGHIIPVAKRPDLQRNPNNCQAQHGTKRTTQTHGYECPGNYAQHDNITTTTPSRPW